MSGSSSSEGSATSSWRRRGCSPPWVGNSPPACGGRWCASSRGSVCWWRLGPIISGTHGGGGERGGPGVAASTRSEWIFVCAPSGGGAAPPPPPPYPGPSRHQAHRRPTLTGSPTPAIPRHDAGLQRFGASRALGGDSSRKSDSQRGALPLKARVTATSDVGAWSCSHGQSAPKVMQVDPEWWMQVAAERESMAKGPATSGIDRNSPRRTPDAQSSRILPGMREEFIPREPRPGEA